MIRTATILAAAATLSLMAAAQTAVAQTAVAQTGAAQGARLYDGYAHDPSKVVTYTRIDLSKTDPETPEGARALLREIAVAADAVCGGAVHAKLAPKDYADCRSDAVDGAVRMLGTPAIRTALAEARRQTLLATK